MNKYTVLLMAFLGVSIILQGVQAQNCQLSFESGSEAYDFKLNNTIPTLIEDFWSLKDINFDGDCDCTLTVYSKNSLTGCSATQAFTSTSSKHIDVVGGIWKRSASPASFVVTCYFHSDGNDPYDFPYDFRALTSEEAADPIAEYIFSNAPSLGFLNSDLPGYHLTGSERMEIAFEELTHNRIYFVTSGLSGNNGERAILQTLMGSGINGDHTTVDGVYLVGWNVIYLN